MKVTYDSEADVLCLVLRDELPFDAAEEPNGVVVSYGEDGEPVSVEFLSAAGRTARLWATVPTSVGAAGLRARLYTLAAMDVEGNAWTGHLRIAGLRR